MLTKHSITQDYLSHATQENREKCTEILSKNKDWASLQQRFLDMVDDYIEVEINKPLQANIDSHEAGGQLRIAIPHQFVRNSADVSKYMQDLMEARKNYTDENLFHGYVDCHEVHHEIETFIYFQQALYYLNLPGKETAAKSILDVAEHTGNWVDGVPNWYNWDNHEFVSTFLGTKDVKDFPPYDYQEGNHFRFTDVAMAAFKITGDKCYLNLIEDYAWRWCNHIEKYAAAGKPIPCSILPEHAEKEELDHAGIVKDENGKYKIFYREVASNTMFDIACGLIDLWRETGKERYLAAAEAMIDQFYINGMPPKPADNYSNGEWNIVEENADPQSPGDYSGDFGFLPRLAVKHAILTGSNKYAAKIAAWAETVDETKNSCDQTQVPLLAAAHFLTGKEDYLTRAYQMALRYCAVTEHKDHFHQCDSNGRQGSKYQVDLLYNAILGDADWATRGSLPLSLIRHITAGKTELPAGVSFRIWRASAGCYSWEAVNSSDYEVSWNICRADNGQVLKSVTLSAQEKKNGSLCI